MLGAIIGDIVGSRFEFFNNKSKSFKFFENCYFTDDTVMTVAVAEALLSCQGDYTSLSAEAVRSMQKYGRLYPDVGYGSSFLSWLQSPNPGPYRSCGNGAAMRVSPCAYAAKNLKEAYELSNAVTCVTHNHPEGLKGAMATTAAIYLARRKHSISEIGDFIHRHFYKLNFTLDELRPTYDFDATCQGTVPQAIMAFLESTDFEDAIRNAVSIGGDSDTVAAITGSIAEAYYGIPSAIKEEALRHLDAPLRIAVAAFYERFER